jgi:predicted unusual protein kinase regulating ubiquinone biosynthesis (AarF/ABC1/UbiB family)
MTGQDRQSRAIAVPAGRLARFTRLGSMTAGVAGNMAIQGAGELGRGRRPNFRSLLMTPQNMSRIADRLAEMRGAAMKIGQLVSMDTGDVLPPELAQIMARLRDDAHFMPPAQLKRVLNEQWPAGWLRQVQTFNVRPIAAASIGQVHRAQLKDGRDLAIKVQYPGVARSIDSDVANVGALIRMSGLLPGGFDLAPYLEEARKQLHDETDYLQEGAYLGEFRDLLRGDARFVLPVLHHDWTTKNILSMSFVDGVPIEQAVSEPQERRDAIATALVDLVLRELFEFRLMQTDPNFANYRYDPESARIVLLDFGATRRIARTVVAQYRDLMRAGLDRDREAMEQVAMQIGFFTSDTHARHRNRILEMMELAFSALLEDDIFDFARTDMPRKMQQEGMKLAQDGFVPPPLPIDVLFLQRKFGGVFLLTTKLGARIGVKDLLLRHL